MTTLAALLFGEGVDAGPILDTALGSDAVGLGRILISGLAVPSADVAGALARLLDVPVGNVAIRGWHQHRKIEQARQQTKDNATDRAVVRLGDHKIKSKQRPVIEATVGNHTMPVLNLELEVEIDVSAVDLVIEQGEVCEVHHGSAVAKAKLSASKVTLAERNFSTVDLTPEAHVAELP